MKILYWAMYYNDQCTAIFPFFDNAKFLNSKEIDEMKLEYFFDHDSMPKGSQKDLEVIHFNPELCGSTFLFNQLENVV